MNILLGLGCIVWALKVEITTILFGQLYKYSSTDANYAVLKSLLDNKTEFVIRVNKETIFFPPPNKGLGRAKINRFLSILDCKKRYFDGL